VGEDAAESVRADVSFADVGVAVHVRCQGKLTVVGVNYMHVVEPEQRFGAAQGAAKTGWRRDIEARGQQMTGVETVTDLQTGKFAGKVAHGLKFLEPAAQVTAGARRVLQ